MALSVSIMVYPCIISLASYYNDLRIFIIVFINPVKIEDRSLPSALAASGMLGGASGWEVGVASVRVTVFDCLRDTESSAYILSPFRFVALKYHTMLPNTYTQLLNVGKNNILGFYVFSGCFFYILVELFLLLSLFSSLLVIFSPAE